MIQKSYLRKGVRKVCKNDKIKPICTFLAPHFKLNSFSCSTFQEECEYMTRVPYTNDMGSLIYAMLCIRPDIS